jgi:hypothetical protein
MCILCDCIYNKSYFDIDNYYSNNIKDDSVFIRKRFNKYSIRIGCNKLKELPKFKSNKSIFDITLDELDMNIIDGTKILDHNNQLLKYNTITITNSSSIKEIINFSNLNGIIIENCDEILLLDNIKNITQLLITATEIIKMTNISDIESIIIENK